MNNEHQRLFALTEHILGLMQAKSGAIAFHDWMRAALYQPRLGYYESEKIFGEQGDFTTAAAMGNWLALGFAESIGKSWKALGQPQNWTLIEQGGGHGDLLVHVLQALATQHIQPHKIIAVEISEKLRAYQTSHFQAHGFDVEVVATLQDIQPTENAILFSNELPDAFPVRAFVYRDKQAFERGVDWDGEKFVWTELSPLTTDIRNDIQAQWANNYCSEINPHLETWQQDISRLFERGVVLTVDYGYTQQEYYRPQRVEGTLMGHYQHQVVEDVLKLSPGVCDITAHVDFSALKQAGDNARLKSIAYTTQGAWLAQTKSVQQQIEKLAAHPSVDNIAEITHAKRLMLPTGMGESFKLLIQAKGLDDKQAQTLVTPAFDRLNTL